MDKIYEISATAVGGREGHVKSADGLIDLDMERPGAIGGKSGATNPETLFAAGWAACFGSAVAFAARLAHLKAGEISVTVKITLGKTEEGNFQLAADIEATIPEVTAEEAAEIVAKAETICPYSRATKGNIEVHVSAKV